MGCFIQPSRHDVYIADIEMEMIVGFTRSMPVRFDEDFRPDGFGDSRKTPDAPGIVEPRITDPVNIRSGGP